MQAKYGDAANVVEQTLGAIRTVSATGLFFLYIHPYISLKTS
jgi:hypothetical protein